MDEYKFKFNVTVYCCEVTDFRPQQRRRRPDILFASEWNKPPLRYSERVATFARW